ncbi:Acid phosphatase 1 [Morus notabilis]|uniref:Acid phosphatase 1 n=2 Tax=Morus notabilis TaxID=981085 RepID=W9R6D9_9ROSA|nr:Acid phosphatase 1 [Morus notabilis]
MLLYYFLATVVLAATSTAQPDLDNPLNKNFNKLHLLRRQGSFGGNSNGAWCSSWQYGVETNNIIGWKTVPEKCELYVARYMLGERYGEDSKVVTKEAYLYAQSHTLSDDGKDVWLFDVDDTAVSNLPYYATNGFGVKPYDPESFHQWILSEAAPALPKSLKLYKNLKTLGFKIIFLTGRRENERSAIESNLKVAGYHTWELVLLKDDDYSGTTADFKAEQRKNLEDAGYRIVGNIGDQWTDLLGTNAGHRTFKLPNPLYYAA